MKKITIGDVFVTRMLDEHKRYIQLIAFDTTKSNSGVVRGFRRDYPLDAEPTLEDIVSDDVDFYLHTKPQGGVKLGYWELVGNIADVGRLDHILFYEFLYQDSFWGFLVRKWSVWKISQPRMYSYVPKRKYVEQGVTCGWAMHPDGVWGALHRFDTTYMPEYKLPPSWRKILSRTGKKFKLYIIKCVPDIN